MVLSAPSMIDEDEEIVDQRTAFVFDSHEQLHQEFWDDGLKPNLHQQADQTILALAILGVNSHEFASAWSANLLFLSLLCSG